MFQTSICITRAAKDISDHACQKTFNLVSWMSFLALQLREHHLHGDETDNSYWYFECLSYIKTTMVAKAFSYVTFVPTPTPTYFVQAMMSSVRDKVQQAWPHRCVCCSPEEQRGEW